MQRILFIIAVIATCGIAACTKPTEGCFNYSKVKFASETSVSFNAACSQNASYFTWNFGDGSADTAVTSLEITHTYTTPGQYEVTLTAERKDGVSSGKEKPINKQTVIIE